MKEGMDFFFFGGGVKSPDGQSNNKAELKKREEA